MVEETLRQFVREKGLVEQVQASLLKSPERSQQVAAVHAGNDRRHELSQRARVIPVEQMPSLSRQLQDCGQSTQRLLGKFRYREIAESAGHLASIEKQAKIRRRNARRNLGVLFLHIIGNQPVVLFSAELGEIPPGAETGDAQQPAVAFRRLFARSSRRSIHPY